MSDANRKRVIIGKLTIGSADRNDVKDLVDIYTRMYKVNPDNDKLTVLAAHKELLWRLDTSVFSEKGERYSIGFTRFCIAGEFHNTALFIKLIGQILTIAKSYGDVTKPEFYGQPDPGYNISDEVLIHILLRHNETINSFSNPDSLGHQRSPSSFEFGSVGPIMLRLFMALNALEESDWKKTEKGKNKYICHFSVGGANYSIIANREKQIISFYPRTDGLNTEFVELTRDLESMKFIRS